MTARTPSSSPELITFGCRLNTYESEVMRGLASDAGLGQAIIVNTCAVTREAERQARQAIRRARKQNPDARIIVTGCAAQTDPEQFARMPEVDQVLGNREKLDPLSYGKAMPPVLVDDIMEVRETATHLVPGFDGKSRAFLQVQNGCDHRCTFCIIPYGRGNSRSVPLGAIVDQARKLAEGGYREFALTGVDITAYGEDLPGRPTLGSMIRRLLAAVPEIRRIRLSSLDPVEIDDELWRLIADEERLAPHLHLSLQAGDDMILKRMKRRHLSADVRNLVAKARALRSDVVFGADIIVGFPTETDEMFANTLTLAEEMGLTYLHVFPYSPRPGTPAARMPQVDGTVRKERAARLRALGTRQLTRFLDSCIGSRENILAESETVGRTARFASVGLEERASPGDFLAVEIIGRDGDRLIGRTA